MHLTSRLATLDDWARLYAWRCDPGTCASFLLPAPPTITAHLAWLQRTLSDPSARLAVVSEGGQTVGTYRIDGDDQFLMVRCSLTVDPRYRGRGLAAPMLRLLVADAQRIWPERPVRAWIQNSNVASLRAFAAAGFTVQAEGAVYVELERRHDGPEPEVYLVDDIDPCNDMGRR